MSRVYFHMLDGTVEVHGSERHRAAQLVEGIGAAILSPYVEKLGLDRMYERPGMLRAHLMMDGKLKFGDSEYNGWQLLLNTALDTGNEQICFLTKFHAQCEIHAWIAGEHRAWLAEVIERAIENKLVRPEVSGLDPAVKFSTGWRELVVALRRTAEHPVVMSYSVTEQFPGPRFWQGGATPTSSESVDDDDDVEDSEDKHAEAFYDHSEAEQWALCMPAIRDMQMTPENLCTYGFGDGMTALGLAEIIDATPRTR